MNIESFKKLYDEHFEQVRRYIYYRCGDEALASDVAQDAFFKLWEKRDVVKAETIVEFLYTIARNIHINNFRHEKIKLNFIKKKIDVEHEQRTENEFYFNETKNQLEEVLARMPSKQREVFLLNRMDGIKYAEIAMRLGISEKAIEKRMKNAVIYLKNHLQPDIKWTVN